MLHSSYIVTRARNNTSFHMLDDMLSGIHASLHRRHIPHGDGNLDTNADLDGIFLADMGLRFLNVDTSHISFHMVVHTGLVLFSLLSSSVVLHSAPQPPCLE